MIILAIDTSSIYASCAVLRDGEIISEQASASGLVHSKALFPMIEGCLSSVGLAAKDVDVFACVAGPGSFTGVRIGVCAVKGLAQGLNKPCAQINTLDALKENVQSEAYICPIMDARRGQVYCAVYKNGAIVRDYDACPIEDVLSFVKNKKTVFLGDGVKVFKSIIEDALGENAIFALPQHNYTRAASAAYLAQRAQEESKLVSADGLNAIYLRKPQAEREYASRNTQS